MLTVETKNNMIGPMAFPAVGSSHSHRRPGDFVGRPLSHCDLTVTKGRKGSAVHRESLFPRENHVQSPTQHSRHLSTVRLLLPLHKQSSP